MKVKVVLSRRILSTVTVAVAMVALPLLYSNCGIVGFSKTNGTSTIGNPKNPTQASSQILSAICSVLNRCQAQVPFDTCLSGASSTTGVGGALGLSSSATDSFSTLETAENTGLIAANAVATNACADTINNLNCSQSVVTGAYDGSSSTPFAGIVNMIPAQACNQVMTAPPTGANLEVPIELFDSGLASSTSPVLFSRTQTSLDTSAYDGVVTYAFEVVASNSDSTTRNASLIDESGDLVAAISIPPSTTNNTRFRTTFLPTPGAHVYRVQTDGTSSSYQLALHEARVLVRQVAATKSKIYVPLFGYNSYTLNMPGFSSDDTSAATDSAWAQNYGQNDPYMYSQWKKNNAAFSQIASGTPWTFEAVLSTAGSGTAYASLFDATSNLQVTASQVSTTAATPTLVTASFADNATNFADQDLVEVRLNNSGGTAYAYRAGLWLQLSNLTHGEVYYRYLRPTWQNNGAGVHQDGPERIVLDLSAFNGGIVYNQVASYVSAPGTTCVQSLFDAGTSDSATTGHAVSGSTFTVASTTKLLQRSGALSIVSGDRFISEIGANAGPGNCFLIGPLAVVGF